MSQARRAPMGVWPSAARVRPAAPTRGERGSSLLELSIFLPLWCVLFAAVLHYGPRTLDLLEGRGATRYLGWRVLRTADTWVKGEAKALTVEQWALPGITQLDTHEVSGDGQIPVELAAGVPFVVAPLRLTQVKDELALLAAVPLVWPLAYADDPLMKAHIQWPDAGEPPLKTQSFNQDQHGRAEGMVREDFDGRAALTTTYGLVAGWEAMILAK